MTCFVITGIELSTSYRHDTKRFKQFSNLNAGPVKRIGMNLLQENQTKATCLFASTRQEGNKADVA